MTKITLETNGSLDLFKGTNEAGKELNLGKGGTAVGPMESVLMAMAGCSTIDIVMILQKMKQDIKDIKVEVDGKRREEIPKIYSDINLHYILIGDVKEKKAEKAIAMSLEKYCSVSLMIQKSSNITSSFEIKSE